jgi:hypothetical protein
MRNETCELAGALQGAVGSSWARGRTSRAGSTTAGAAVKSAPIGAFARFCAKAWPTRRVPTSGTVRHWSTAFRAYELLTETTEALPLC